MNKTYLIDVTAPQNNNVRKKEVAKKKHYKQLKNEVNRIRKRGTEAVPVVIGTTEIVTKNFRMHTNKISNNINIEISSKFPKLDE